jgi:putative glutamine amidotransferase
MKIPKIGIPFWRMGDNSLGVTLPYYTYFERFGYIVVLNPMVEPNQELYTDIDLLVLPGGADILPERYNHMPSLFTGKPDLIKDYFDMHVLPRYIADTDIPIFGICRGFQSIAVHFGYPLIQDMYHETNKPDKRWENVHKLSVNSAFVEEMAKFNEKIEDNSDKIYDSLYNIKLPFNREYDKIKKRNLITFSVNSLHHQAVSSTQIEEDKSFNIIAKYQGAFAPFIEAMVSEDSRIAGVQYHPEELFDEPIAKYLIYKLLYKV